MKRVSIGALRHRLTLERLEITPVGGGAEEATWTPFANVFASIRAMSGREVSRGDRFSGTISHVIALRYRAGVTPEMRFRKDDRVFNIRSVLDPDERRRWLVCDCEEHWL